VKIAGPSEWEKPLPSALFACYVAKNDKDERVKGFLYFS